MHRLLVVLVVLAALCTALTYPMVPAHALTDDARFPLHFNKIGGRYLTDANGNVRVLTIWTPEEALRFLRDVNLVNDQHERAYPQIFLELRAKHGVETPKPIDPEFSAFTKAELDLLIERAIVRYAIYQLGPAKMDAGLDAYRAFYAGASEALPLVVAQAIEASQPGQTVESSSSKYVAAAPLPSFPPASVSPALLSSPTSVMVSNDRDETVTLTNDDINRMKGEETPPPAEDPPSSPPPADLPANPPAPDEPAKAPEDLREINKLRFMVQLNQLKDQVLAWANAEPADSNQRRAAIRYTESFRPLVNGIYPHSSAEAIEAALEEELRSFPRTFENEGNVQKKVELLEDGYKSHLALLREHHPALIVKAIKNQVETEVSLNAPKTVLPSPDIIASPSPSPPKAGSQSQDDPGTAGSRRRERREKKSEEPPANPVVRNELPSDLPINPDLMPPSLTATSTDKGIQIEWSDMLSGDVQLFRDYRDKGTQSKDSGGKLDTDVTVGASYTYHARVVKDGQASAWSVPVRIAFQPRTDQSRGIGFSNKLALWLIALGLLYFLLVRPVAFYAGIDLPPRRIRRRH